ncbi:MAG: OPT/YSL family transporter [Planctomycetes bacterium]|nr:OPT/YSL family transporter [Planctomycetota bacterium]
MASPTTSGGSQPGLSLPEGVPPLAEDATPEQKDLYWYTYVYQGDKMPQLTIRAVIMGGVLGMLMSASNLYTTLAIGWAFGVAITACVMSYVIWSAIRLCSGKRVELFLGAVGVELVAFALYMRDVWPLWAALLLGIAGIAFFSVLSRKLPKMSVLENNCMASTASAAGYSTGSTLATMFGSLLLLTDPKEGQTYANILTRDLHPVWVVIVFTLCTGLMGVFLAIPLKKQMINHEQLRFPSGIAAAETLRSLYSESAEAMQKAYSLLAGIAAGVIVGILNTGEGTLKALDRVMETIKSYAFDLRLPEQVPAGGFFRMAGDKLLGFGFARDAEGHIIWNKWATATEGMKGYPVAAFGFEPSVLLIAAGIITGLRVCVSMFVGALLLHAVAAPMLMQADLTIAGSGWAKDAAGDWVFTIANKTKDAVINMDFNRAGTVVRPVVWGLWGGTAVMVFSSLTAVALQWKTIVRAFKGLSGSSSAETTAAMRDIEVPTSWMVVGLIPIAIAMLFVQIVAFKVGVFAGIVAILVPFVLSLVACRATGETDTTPIGAMGKVMQLLFAVLAPNNIQANVAAAGIAANSASSSADLLTDLKSGYLLGANPRKQFLAQFVGVFFGTIAIVPIWYLMVPSREAIEKFAAPASRQWEAVARILVQGVDRLPHTAQIAILVGALVGIGLPVIDRLLPSKYRRFLPSAMGLGLSWVIPFSSAIGFFVGAIIGWLWEKSHKRSYDAIGISTASGLIAGESLTKAVVAMWATAIGLRGGS